MGKLLIVTARTGAGHDSVARTLQEAVHDVGGGRVRTEVIDLLAGGQASWIGRLSRLYGPLIVHHPRAWGLVYGLSNSERFWRGLRGLAGKAWRDMVAKTLLVHAPDLILCTHPLCNQVVAEGWLRSKNPPPFVAVVTELNEAHAAWAAPEATLHVAATEEVRGSLLARGIDPLRVRTLGLPIAPRFFAPGDRRRARRALGLDEEGYAIMLAGGGEGAGPIATTANAIAAEGLPVQLIIACGRNGALRRYLIRHPPSVPHRVLPFHDNMPQVVEAADVVVGKAGALTLGEAVAASKPIIMLRPLPGQERGNADFARRHGVGLEVSGQAELVAILQKWLADPCAMSAHAANGNALRDHWLHAASRIATAALAILKGGKHDLCVPAQRSSPAQAKREEHRWAR
ncbi:MAG: hypothetical protein HY675_10970 [Chloroflexi bacterium]|nr:hypothetical protein [Chloroflexota bacterium]